MKALAYTIALLLFTSVLLSSQLTETMNWITDDYTESWKEVDQLDSRGLPKSALPKVEDILMRARREKNPVQEVKAVTYLARLTSELSEDGAVAALAKLEGEAERSSFPAKNVLHALTAKAYWQHYQNNRYQILQRTSFGGGPDLPEDVLTWDVHHYITKIIALHERSLENAEGLKEIQVDAFDAIIEKGEPRLRVHRPTLYDFVTHLAIGFYSSGESGATLPSDHFTPGVDYFDVDRFQQMEISSSDNRSFPLLAFKLFQSLEQFHAEKQYTSALIDNKRLRLGLAHSLSTLPNKDALFEAGLRQLLGDHKDLHTSSLVSHDLANLIQTLARKADPEDPNYKRVPEAVKICDDAIAAFPESMGGQRCSNLRARLLNPSIGVHLPSVVLPNKPILAKLDFTNLSALHFKIVKLDKHDKMENPSHQRDRLNKLLKQPEVTTWDIKLPDPGDHQSHTIEFAIPERAYGHYAIIGSDKEDPRSSNGVAFTTFTVSEISFTYKTDDNGRADLYAINRETGAPLSNVAVELYTVRHNWRTEDYTIRRVAGPLKTDAEGQLKIAGKDRESQYFTFQLGDDYLVSDEQVYLRKVKGWRDRTGQQTHFFTDRAIYRPGQTVYFKGIKVNLLNGTSTTLATNQPVSVQLYDVNRQKIGEVETRTNAFGSFSGSFVLPSGILTGRFSLNEANGSHQISVEEYKRPRFEVTFDTLASNYRVNEEITVTGNAKAYAGANLTDAAVSYRVVRSARYPIWGWWSCFDISWFRPVYPTSAEQQISNGVAQVDKEGKFEITFEAIPDATVSRKWDPEFVYRIEADVTDISGETQSGSTNLVAGYKSLKARIIHDKVLKTGDKQSLAIQTRNLSDKEVPSRGTITIARLETPGLQRARLWKQPDLSFYAAEEFRSKFPWDAYGNEDLPTLWKALDKVYDKPFETNEEGGKLEFDPAGWKAGTYRIKLETKDVYGETVSYEGYFSVMDNTPQKSASVPGLDPLWIDDLADAYEPGETIQLQFGSPYEANIFCEVRHKERGFKPIQLFRGWKSGKAGKIHTVNIPVTEAHRGGMSLEIRMVHQNRLIEKKIRINVPWSNKDLNVSLETFRSKLEPGSEEEWRIKVRGPGGERVAAELLVGMYDASLDAFLTDNWDFVQWHSNITFAWTGGSFGLNYSQLNSTGWGNFPNDFYPQYDKLKLGDHYRFRHIFGHDQILHSVQVGNVSMRQEPDFFYADGINVRGSRTNALEEVAVAGIVKSAMVAESGNETRFNLNANAESESMPTTNQAPPPPAPKPIPVPIRSDLRETAFFFPQLKTDEDGNVIFSFKTPEALTRWKLRAFSHDKELRAGSTMQEVVTQKELMVIPNLPRFFRQGDEIVVQAKISSLQDKPMSGQAYLKLLDASTMKEVTDSYTKAAIEQTFSIDPKGNTVVRWSLDIPMDGEALVCQISAQAENFTDGEEAPVPVLTNRMLVTESLPLPIRKAGTKNYRLEKLINQSAGSASLRNHQVTLEFTSNPAWYVIQALPYMMDYPYECAEQTFTRFYANSIAHHIANSDPRIRNVFNQWKGTEALLSPLEKNEDLKSLLIEETPWVLSAKNESDRKRRIGQLFEENQLQAEMRKNIARLKQLQNGNGGWPWFKGGRSNDFITRHIIAGFGHLERMQVLKRNDHANAYNLNKAITYIDENMQRHYNDLVQHNRLQNYSLGASMLHYLYTRSFFLDIPYNGNQEALKFFLQKAKVDWLQRSIYNQGLTALSLHRWDNTDYIAAETIPADIVASLSERAMQNEEFGMYWKENTVSYYWYQAPIETQSLLIEMYHELTDDRETVEELKVWLLKQKQTQNWKTTKATADACYALLVTNYDGQGAEAYANMLFSEAETTITLAGEEVQPEKKEAGTGYFRQDWHGGEIEADMGEVSVTRSEDGVAWGALYWQYFEDLDKITPAETPLSLEKKLFVQVDTKSGKQLKPITEDDPIKLGDLITVRVTLRSDRDMEYVHLKDMRASGFEPLNVLSGYKYRSGLGYYESTRDAATNFFIGWLRKGTYVFEYNLRASQVGDFSNGITTVQCMYAPEFSSHSEGIRVTIE